ncbi:MAG: metallophosphoesterase [Gemmatimonadota bacterium]
MSTTDPPSPKAPLRPRTGVIWHLTDLHFPPEPVKITGDHKALPFKKRLFDRSRPFQELIEYANDCGDLRADYLVVSGDFVDAARLRVKVAGRRSRKTTSEQLLEQGRLRRAAFEQARDFVTELAKAHGLDKKVHERVVVCPGNHDVDWAAAVERPGESLVDFRAVFGSFVSPYSHRPFTLDADSGVCILPLDTTPLGGAKFYDIASEPVQLDAGAYLPDQVDTALARLRAEFGQPAACPGGLLGFVVAHHPPMVTPTAGIEVKPFEIAIGAGQAKYALHGEGFRVFLNGHKHLGVVHQEHVYPGFSDSAEGVLILSGPAFLSTGGEGRGFTVIEYAVSPDSGEARVRVHPHGFDNYQPRPGTPRLFYVAPRGPAPARELRITERISPSGDSRADYEYREVPLPRDGDGAGWTDEDGSWTRYFARDEGADQDVASPPRFVGLTPGVLSVDCDLPPDLEQRANRRFSIRVRVDRDAPEDSVSFMERVFSFGAYAVSKSHQRRIAGMPTTCPGLQPGWEAIMHTVHEPVERLEFNVCLPFALVHDYPVEVEAYVHGDTGQLEACRRLLEFTPCRVETNFRAKRLAVSLRYPMVGVTYLVKWELPENDPVVGERTVHDPGYTDGIEWAARFQEEVLRPGTGHDEIGEALRELVEEHLEALYAAGGAVTEDALEWSFFVPERQGGGPVVKVMGRPKLVPAFANFPRESPRWMSWPAGRGVVGRSFALNTQVQAISPSSSRYSSAPANEWVDVPMPVYEKKQGSIDHSVLYGLPVVVPGRPDIVWAVFCLGTARKWSKLNLNVMVPSTAGGAPTEPASHSLMKALTDVFSRKLARFMSDGGTPFAVPLAG